MEKGSIKAGAQSSDFSTIAKVGDVSSNLTVPQIFRGILQSAPKEEITLTLPSAAHLVHQPQLTPVQGYVWRFSLRNDGQSVINLSTGDGGVTDGNMSIKCSPDAARFVIRYINVASGNESYILVRE